MIKRWMLMGAVTGAAVLATASMPVAAQSPGQGKLGWNQVPQRALSTSSGSAASWSSHIAGLDTRVSLPAQPKRSPVLAALNQHASDQAMAGDSARRSPWPCSHHPVMSSQTNSARTAALIMLALAVTDRSVSDQSAGSAICQPAGH